MSKIIDVIADRISKSHEDNIGLAFWSFFFFFVGPAILIGVSGGIAIAIINTLNK